MEYGQKPGKVLFLKIALKFKENWKFEPSRKTVSIKLPGSTSDPSTTVCWDGNLYISKLSQVVLTSLIWEPLKALFLFQRGLITSVS